MKKFKVRIDVFLEIQADQFAHMVVQVKIHFKNGYNMFKLFDYSQSPPLTGSANAGNYEAEHNNFRCMWKAMTERLQVPTARLL